MSDESNRDGSRFRQIRAVFEAALDRPPESREVFIRREAGGDSALADAVLALLSARTTSSGDDGEPTAEHVAPADLPPPEIPGYEIDRCLGGGGMGLVYAARRERTGQHVALKVPRSWALPMSHRDRVRLDREGSFLVRVECPGVARVLDVGTWDAGHGPLPYVAVELVEGVHVDAHVRAHRLDRGEILRLAARIAETVDAIARVGIVHRDLKPANVLVEADGTPRIIDFGTALLFDDPESRSRLTTAGESPGTMRYMSPEQIDPRRGPIDRRSDVYALAVLVQELLTGESPYGADVANRWALASRVRDAAVIPLRQARPDLDRDTEAVLIRALAAHPGDRYEDAGRLAADLRRCADHEPVSVRPLRWHERGRRFVRRRPWIAASIALAATTLLAVAGGLATALSALRDADRARALAETLFETIEEMHEFQSGLLVEFDVGRTSAAVRDRLREVLRADEPTAAGESRDDATTANTLAVLERVAADAVAATIRAGVLAPGVADLESRFADVPAIRGRLLSDFGATADAPDDSVAAEDHLRRAIDVLGDCVPEDDESLLEARIRLAWLLRRVGRYDEALRIVTDAYRLSEAGSDLRRQAAETRGLTLQMSGRYAEGLEFVEEARRLAEKPADRIAAWSNRGSILHDLARFEEAEHAYREAIRIAEGHPEHRVLALTPRVNLGLLLKNQWRLDEALQIYERAREVSVRSRGADHFDVHRLEFNIARLHQDAGRVDVALRAFERLHHRLTRDGRTNADVARQMANESTMQEIATLRLRAGCPEEAEPMLARLVRIRHERFGPADPRTERTLTQYGHCLRALDRPEEAEVVFDARLDLRLGTFDTSPRRVAVAAGNLALAHFDQGRYAEALDLLRFDLALQTETFGPEHAEILRIRDSIAVTLQKLGRLAEAESMLRATVAELRERLGTNHEWTVNATANLAYVMECRGRTAEAWRLAHAARDEAAARLGSDHPKVADLDRVVRRCGARLRSADPSPAIIAAAVR